MDVAVHIYSLFIRTSITRAKNRSLAYHRKRKTWDKNDKAIVSWCTMHKHRGVRQCAYLIFVIFLHSHIFRPGNFTLKSAQIRDKNCLATKQCKSILGSKIHIYISSCNIWSRNHETGNQCIICMHWNSFFWGYSFSSYFWVSFSSSAFFCSFAFCQTVVAARRRVAIKTKPRPT